MQRTNAPVTLRAHARGGARTLSLICGGFAGDSLFIQTPDVRIAAMSVGTCRVRTTPASSSSVALLTAILKGNDCARIQEHSFDVTFDGANALVANGECADVGGAVFLGVRTFRILQSRCTDVFDGFTWAAMWPAP